MIVSQKGLVNKFAANFAANFVLKGVSLDFILARGDEHYFLARLIQSLWLREEQGNVA